MEMLEPRILLDGVKTSVLQGGTGAKYAQAVVVASDGDCIIAGVTYSTDMDGAGAFNGGTMDAFVAPFTDGYVLEWCKYFGGNAEDTITGTAVDESDNIYISGQTASSDLPSAFGTYQESYDGFVAKFNSPGTLQWSRYIGGTSADAAYGLVVDVNSDIVGISAPITTAILMASSRLQAVR